MDSDEEDIAELSQMLLKLKFIGVEIRSFANNQVEVIDKVGKNSGKISDLKLNTANQINKSTYLILDRVYNFVHMHRGLFKLLDPGIPSNTLIFDCLGL